MGSSHSKRSNRSRKNDTNDQSDVKSDGKKENGETPADRENELDKQYIEDIKKDLCENPEMFVLNNMLMAVMFFENYQRDILEIGQRRNEPIGTYYCQDLVMEKVNENIRYRTKHGQNKNKIISENLAPKRIFILNDFIKILGPMEEMEVIESSLVRCEESQKKGFTRLRELVPSYPHDDSPLISVDGESTSCSSRTSSNEDYASYDEMKSAKPSDEFKTLNIQGSLPRTCIEHRRNKKLDLPQDIRFENITEDDLYEVVSYISSKGVMDHFLENIFPNHAEEKLDLTKEELGKRKPLPGKIICKHKNEELSQTWEVVPAVPIKWPGEQTLEFIMKSQRSPGMKTKILFPHPAMVGEIMRLGAVVVPKGCFAHNRQRKDTNLEWEFYFPQAEQYMESFMTHSQMKSYLILLCLYKTYVAPMTFEKGLLIEHIRTFFMAHLDNNFRDWPEHKLGTKLVALLKQLNVLIGSSDLRDYFITEKKPLEYIAKKYLRENQRVFHDIIASPLMGFMKSLKNLQYVKGSKKFFTPFDFDKLYTIVTQRGAHLTNSSLVKASPMNRNRIPVEKLDPDTNWSHVNENVKRVQIMKQKELEKQREIEEELERRTSDDYLDLSWICDKNFDIHKKRALLKFFIDIFLKICMKCRKFLWYRQGLLYLKQVKYLTEILKQECAAFGDEVREILEVADSEELKLQVMFNEPITNGTVRAWQDQMNDLLMKNAKQTDATSPKNRRKTVAFNFDPLTDQVE